MMLFILLAALLVVTQADDNCLYTDSSGWSVNLPAGGSATMSDGCTNCICTWDAQLACYEDDCTIPLKFGASAGAGSCMYAGPNGSTMYADPRSHFNDGCNTCWCTRTGFAACSKIFCPHKCEITNDDGANGWLDVGTSILQNSKDNPQCARSCTCTDTGFLGAREMVCGEFYCTGLVVPDDYEV